MFFLNASNLNIGLTLPFAGLLLSMAFGPLLAEMTWHRHDGKITFVWAAAFLVPSSIAFGLPSTFHAFLQTMLLDYVPFVILLTALFAVSGGIVIVGKFHGTPVFNTVLLAVGALAAGFIGTTGASLLLIRPLIRANSKRARTTHIIVFFIFLVSNIGGALTPLGDPPLFLGFLKGIDFFWPLQHLAAPTFVVLAVVLAVFFALDTHEFQRHKTHFEPRDSAERYLHFEGWLNLLLLLCIMATVVASGFWQPHHKLSFLGVEIGLQDVLRNIALLLIVGVSEVFTPAKIRRDHVFSWKPMIEVAQLFAGIFVTLIPVVALLRAGTTGAFAPLLHLMTRPDNEPLNATYFWLSGGLSSFVDNAPTYLVFFNLAGGDPHQLMGPMASTLTAISVGSVFMGANSYIGNAPNLMVRAIAESRGIKMPGFLGYMLWSGAILMPCFLLISWIFFG